MGIFTCKNTLTHSFDRENRVQRNFTVLFYPFLSLSFSFLFIIPFNFCILQTICYLFLFFVFSLLPFFMHSSIYSICWWAGRSWAPYLSEKFIVKKVWHDDMVIGNHCSNKTHCCSGYPFHISEQIKNKINVRELNNLKNWQQFNNVVDSSKRRHTCTGRFFKNESAAAILNFIQFQSRLFHFYHTSYG